LTTGVNVIKLFSSYLTFQTNKLQRVSPASNSSLV